MKITEAMNTWGPALAMLHQKGFVLEASNNDDGHVTWVASTPSLTLTASNPVALLGLLLLAEAKKKGRDTSNGNTLYARLMNGETIQPDQA